MKEIMNKQGETMNINQQEAGVVNSTAGMTNGYNSDGENIVMDDEYTSKMMRTDQDWFEKREKILDHPFIIEKVGQRDEIKVGGMGFPELASKELGEKVCNEIVDSLCEYIDYLENNK